MWRSLLQEEMEKTYFKDLEAFLTRRIKDGAVITPTQDLIFNALELCAPEKTKVVIIGQDPYPALSHANGLAFSVPRKVLPENYPPTLKNIYRRLKAEYGREPNSGDLSTWAYSGVLLLNRVLTTEVGKRAEHEGQGWELFTEAVVRVLLKFRETPMAFLLWGQEAQRLESLIKLHSKKQPHLIIKTSHPSPLSVHKGFVFCQQFRRVNEFLLQYGYRDIDWLYT